jgi:hypothetical protein
MDGLFLLAKGISIELMSLELTTSMDVIYEDVVLEAPEN